MPFLFRHATTSERKKKNHDQIKLKKKEGRTLSTEDNSSSFVTAGPGACVEKTRGDDGLACQRISDRTSGCRQV